MLFFKPVKFHSIIRSMLLMATVVLVTHSSYAAAIFNQNLERMNINKDVRYLEDPSGKVTFKDIINNKSEKKFKTTKGKSLNFGFSPSVYWAEFDLINKTQNEKILLEIGYPLLDHIEIYLIHKGQVIKKSITGDHISFSKRPIQHRNFIYEMDLKKNTIYKVLLRIQSESSIQFPLTLWTKTAFLNNTSKEYSLWGIYFGFLLIMVFYNLFIYYSVKDRNYLLYVVYISAAILTQATLYGFLSHILPESPIFVNTSLPIFLSLDLFFGSLFCISFLNTKKNTPKTHIGIFAILVLIIMSAPLVFIASYGSAIKLTMLLLVLLPIFLIIAGINALRAGVKTARFFLMGWVALLLGLIFTSLGASGIIENQFLAQYSVQIGTAIEVLLLSLALADRINILKKEKENALKEKLAESEKIASMSRAFQRFVPLKFLDLLGKENITQIILGDNVSKEMTISFSDIRSFTNISEKMSPEDNFKFINSFLKRMQPVIDSNNGFIDKFLGDAIMALFDAKPEDAVTAALQQHHALITYNENRLKSGYDPIKIGIGINTGPLMLGTIGADNRMEGTVISDAVNLASRLEKLTKKYESSILISDNTYNKLLKKEKFYFRKLDRVLVRGKNRAVTIFEVLDPMGDVINELKLKTLTAFNEAINLYQSKKIKDAYNLFQEIFSQNKSDKVAAIYIDRCKQLINKPELLDRFDGVARIV